ncbi:MAG: MATE family efflux transporter [Rhodospirillales bacterium]|nr:MATE family efflux transporter [Rhodospirillales bacterium]
MIAPWTRTRTILGLALPIVLVLLAHSLVNVINLAMVSHLGDAAVAGVGIANALFSMLMAVLFGIDAGVQALVAQRVGAGQVRLAGVVLNDALVIAGTAGLLLALLGYAAGPGLFRLVSSEPAVTAHGLAYLDAALPMLLFLGASFAFGAYRNGSGRPHYSLVVAAIQLPFSALFGYLLIFGACGLPRLETAGAGLGTALAALVGLAVHWCLASHIAPVSGFLRTMPDWRGMRLILRIGLPVGTQQSLVYLGMMIYLSIIGRLGTAEVAAMNVVLAVVLLATLAAAGVGTAAATLVGMALGQGDAASARRWGWEAASFGALGILAFSLILVMAPAGALSLFIVDRTIVELATVPLGVMAFGMSTDAYGRILGFALRGAGATRLVTAVAFALQWGAQLPLAWLVGVHLGFGLPGMAISRVLLAAAETAIVTMMWRDDFWSRSRGPNGLRDAQ